MEVDTESKIPAFYMWKVFNDTMPSRLNSKIYNQSNVQRLVNIVKSTEFSNILVYPCDGTLSYDQYKTMSKKYKAFTVWLLGRFFNLLNADRLSSLHDLIIDAQINILNALSYKEASVFNELMKEYIEIFQKLIECHKTKQENQKISAFVPEQIEDLMNSLDLSQNDLEIQSKENLNTMILKIFLIIEWITEKCVSIRNLTLLNMCLDSLLYIVAECNIKLKLSALNVYKNITKYDLNVFKSSMDILEKCNKFINVLQQLSFEILNGKIEVEKEMLESLCDILKTVLKNEKNQTIVKEQLNSLMKLLFDSLRTETCYKIMSINQINDLLVYCAQIADTNNNLYSTLFKFHSPVAEHYIVTELKQVLKQNRTREDILVTNETRTWIYIKKFVETNNLDAANVSELKKDLQQLKDILYMIKNIKLKIHKESDKSFPIQLNFLHEEEVLNKILFIFKGFTEIDLGQFDINLLLDMFAILPICVRLTKPAINTVMAMLWPFDTPDMKKPFNDIFKVMKQKCTTKKNEFCNAFYKFMYNISSGIVMYENIEIELILSKYLQVFKQFQQFENQVPESIPNIIVFGLCGNIHPESIIIYLFNNYPVDENSEYYNKYLLVYKTIICILHTCFVRVVTWNEKLNSLDIKIICLECEKSVDKKLNNTEKMKRIKERFKDKEAAIFGVYNLVKESNNTSIKKLQDIWRKIYRVKKVQNKAIITVLPELMKHTDWINQNCLNIFDECMKHTDVEIRIEFSKYVNTIISNLLEHNLLSQSEKDKLLENFLEKLSNLVLTALGTSDFELQETIFETLQEVCKIPEKAILHSAVALLIPLIMGANSKQSLLSVEVFNSLTKRHNTTISMWYKLYRQKMCIQIFNLCVYNQMIADWGLASSLDRISLVLGFFGTKDFLVKELPYFLPHLIVLIVNKPATNLLLNEMLTMIDQHISDVLRNNYSNIFLHIFLKENDEVFKASMKYLEANAGMIGSQLRKKNFKVLLNELLLNFSQYQHRVLLGLTILAEEDTESPVQRHEIPDYIQPKFLGVLVYFDSKLNSTNSNKKDILLSLAAIFKFMGHKRIALYRFKIIAMLRTVLSLNEDTLEDLKCDIWKIFVQNCDLKALGPQLATIFISIIPLINQHSVKINAIFKFLVVDNEEELKDYLLDLFFIVDSTTIDYEIVLVIKKQMEIFEQKNFQEQLKIFIKYLTHETVDIRVHALKFLRQLIEKNREELDQMILGYNGIDPIIVELVDILTLGCRETDSQLKLACGECIAELGAIEPSHFPRKCTQDAKSFTFYITEDAFILNTLSELIRALLAENYTQNMDRYSFAIQETLKIFEVAPNKQRQHLWNGLPESQKELLNPLLSSRYTMLSSPSTNNNVCPIYGSPLGSTFQSWAYNWMVSLVSSLKPDSKNVLQVYLPSSKLDYRTMMHFLPHIFLHSLIEGNTADREKSIKEIMCVLNSFKVKGVLDQKLLNTRPLCTTNVNFTLTENSPEEVQILCTKAVFIVLDYLFRWIREFEWQKGVSCKNNENYKAVKEFTSRLCKLQLAKVNFQCGEYPRALMYLEEYLTENPMNLKEHHYFLATLYRHLGEPDGVAGITALQHTEPSLELRILSLEVLGKLGEVAACYERIKSPLKLQHLEGLVQCYLDLDNVNTALNFAQGSLKLQPEYTDALLEMQSEPLWRLGRWDDLETLLDHQLLKGNKSWGVHIGNSLLHLRKGKRNEFQNVLSFLKGEQVSEFGAASLEEGAYQHGYNNISKLHALNELEQVEKVIYELLNKSNNHPACENILKTLTSEWELRIKIVQESTKIIEPILCLRRVALEQAKEILQTKVPDALPHLNSLIGECWLLSAKVARETGAHQQAFTYSLKAEEYAPPRLFLEKAKLHWSREEHEQALTTLTRGLEKLIPQPQSINDLSKEQRIICAEAKLLIASYNDSTSNVDKDVNMQHYKEAVDMFKEWEKSWVCLAQYYDRIFQSFSEEDKDIKGGEMQLHMINCFGKSLLYGTTYVYQSMPRMLSIWFDYGTRLLDVTDQKVKDERKAILMKMRVLINSFLERLPSYIFLTAFSQLISRICHPQKEVYLELKSIIIQLILQYPQQSLWMIIPVVKSSYSVRSKRCMEILSDSQLTTPNMIKFIGDFTKLAEKLIELCNKNITEKVTTASVNSLVRTLPKLLARNDFSEIMMPTQKFRKLVLPNPDFKSMQHNPFPNHYVHIVGIEDEMQILNSLQKPRKIVLKGSDGNKYIQMLKPKDDLRKDFRLMEFNDIVNQLLSRDAEARQRRLYIRLYSVAPLNEECGLIEWIPNLVGLRPILNNLYHQKGLGMQAKELKSVCCNQRDSFSKKKEVFLTKLLPKHPPVMGEWFKKTFPDAQSWLNARTAYIHTTAVISMTGYILGLGDRHGENILLDSTCGDTVHVDFNCLFNKGESFEWPERVPFRLTHNMVAAMGPLGVEGIFRKSCVCTLRVLRTNINTLMSIVTPFVYDPLVSWPRNMGASAPSNAERTNEQALEHIKNIKLRLQGMMRTKGRSFSIPLSIEGQTNNLILEAINVDNLCQMYIGWLPFL